MTHSTPIGPVDPFGGGVTFSNGPAPQGPGAPRPHADAKTMATLSIVFAFVFAPVGAVLGHLALSQIKRGGNPEGRDRALVGLTLSYVIILVAVVGLLLWAVTAHHDPGPTVHVSASAPAPTHAPLVPNVQTTVITPPPPARRTVNVEDLRMGDCVEIQQTQPDPRNVDSQLIKIFPVNCESRDGVFRVDVISSSTSPCTEEYLVNQANTIFACISKFQG